MSKCFTCEHSKVDNPWCNNCKEKDCLVSTDGTCEMVRKYLQYTKEHQNENESLAIALWHAAALSTIL